jgi:hypothetical protein
VSAGACKGCGKKILWAKLGSGGSVPLDPVPPVYRLTLDDNSNFVAFRAEHDVNVGDAFFVSHFATCPRANDFTKKALSEPDHKAEAAGDAQP